MTASQRIAAAASRYPISGPDPWRLAAEEIIQHESRRASRWHKLAIVSWFMLVCGGIQFVGLAWHVANEPAPREAPGYERIHK